MRELDLAAAAHGVTRSDVVRELLSAPMRTVDAGPMDAAELAIVVSEAARLGNVPAMKLRLEMLRRADESAVRGGDPLREIDELAARRAADLMS